ncbi:hypothetical protein [Streptomyces sp. NPDC008001]|uniref:hypothetical protein n=1 Tax=Streptomyces sp. NPDC008001 TaxID=3364804 RepID=UPI0036EB731C
MEKHRRDALSRPAKSTRLFIVSAVIGMGLQFPVGSPAAAASSGGSLTTVSCPVGSQFTTYQPGLNLTSRYVDYVAHGTLAACLSSGSQDVKGAKFTTTGSGNTSCLSGDVTEKSVYHWNTGATSVVESRFKINLKPNGTTVVVSTGSVVSGLFAGATTVQTKILPNTGLLACLSPQGMTGAGGPVSMTVTG